MKKRNRHKIHFTLVELLVVIAVIAILSALLLPALIKAKQTVYSIRCLAILKQAGLSFYAYIDDYTGYLPPVRTSSSSGEYWDQLLADYLGKAESHYSFGYNIMRCPSANKKGTLTYGANYTSVFGYGSASNYSIASRKIYNVPSRTFIIADIDPAFDTRVICNPNPSNYFAFSVDLDGDGVLDSYTDSRLYNGIMMRHQNGANFLFSDNSARHLMKNDWITNKNDLWDIAGGKWPRP